MVVAALVRSFGGFFSEIVNVRPLRRNAIVTLIFEEQIEKMEKNYTGSVQMILVNMESIENSHLLR